MVKTRTMAKAMVIRLVFFGFFLLNFLPAFSQNVDNYQIGYYWDMDGKMIEGYYDFTTEFKRPLKVKIVVGDNYTPRFSGHLSRTQIVRILIRLINL